jgi:lysophospholipase L1-like esterase
LDDAVLGLGDSITVGPEQGAYGVPPRPWPQWLAEALDAPFHRLARAGATTPEIARDLLPRAGSSYAVACVHVGTNDVRAPDFALPPFTAALEEILDGLAPRARRVCVATIPRDLGRPRAGAKVGELDAAIRTLAAAHGAVVVDLDDLGGWRRVLPDAVHPTALGHIEIARRAAAALGLPAPIAAPSCGLRADLRYAVTQQARHLARDAGRRARER